MVPVALVKEDSLDNLKSLMDSPDNASSSFTSEYNSNQLQQFTLKEQDYEESFVESNNELSQEELGAEPRSIIFSMMKQLTKGMDLHRVAFPTFVLEPRSLLEKMTDFMAHPQLISSTSLKEDSIERFVDVIRYFLSGWHIRPKGVKKPYNPVLGEFYRCRWNNANGSSSFYVAEQVSHHPPISAYFYVNPSENIIATGNFKPKSKFLGNSVVSIMNGVSYLYFINLPGEEYRFSNPNIYARGILFGTMQMEVGDLATVTCEKNDLMAEIDFKTKGFFAGSYNSLSGKIKRISTNEILFTISGKWTDKIYITKANVSKQIISQNISNGELNENHKILFDAKNEIIVPKLVPPIDKQDMMESRKLWKNLTDALLIRNYENASIQKSIVEEEQRKISKYRESGKLQWKPRFFNAEKDGFWSIQSPSFLKTSPKDAYISTKSLLHSLFGI